MDRDYVIWSFEHDAWWGPGRCGYTPELAQAGWYTKAEADQIVAQANLVQVHEHAMRLSFACTLEAKGWHPLTPGAYDDGQGGMHLVLTEMLALHGYADTPANRQMLIDAVREMMGSAAVVVED